MSAERATVATLANQLAEMVKCAFLEGYNAGHADGESPRDAGAMAKAWTNSQAYDDVSPGEGLAGDRS